MNLKQYILESEIYVRLVNPLINKNGQEIDNRSAKYTITIQGNGSLVMMVSLSRRVILTSNAFCVSQKRWFGHNRSFHGFEGSFQSRLSNLG